MFSAKFHCFSRALLGLRGVSNPWGFGWFSDGRSAEGLENWLAVLRLLDPRDSKSRGSVHTPEEPRPTVPEGHRHYEIADVLKGPKPRNNQNRSKMGQSRSRGLGVK